MKTIWQMGVAVRDKGQPYKDTIVRLFEHYSHAKAEMKAMYPSIRRGSYGVKGCIEFYETKDDLVMVTLQTRIVW